MNTLLSVNNIHINYGKQEVVTDVSFNICNNQIVCIVGESGSGKTTLIKTIAHLLPQKARVTHGNILLEQNNLMHYTKKEWYNIRGKGIFIMFQNSGDYLSPSKRIKYQFYDCLKANYGMNRQTAIDLAINMLKKVGLTDYNRILEAFPFQLSGGMKQCISIAIAMALKPKLVLVDEPTSALDVITKKQIIDELYMLKKDSSIIMVTHDIASALHIADKIILMKDGAIVETGNKTSILNHAKHPYTKLLLNAVPVLKGD